MEESNKDYKSLTIYNLLVEKTKYHWNNCNSLLEYLNKSFAHYHKHIKALEGDVQYKVLQNHEISVGLHHKIFETVFYYLRGEIPASYNSMKEAFELVENILVSKSAKNISSSGKFVFKARVQKAGNTPPTLREDLFHIPFEKRHLVQDQRFSTHGIPSVYLGESIYDCYLELGEPDLNKFWVSLFHFPQQIKLVDLTFAYRQHDLWLLLYQVKKDTEKYAETLDKLVNDILLWPLIMACSIVCRFPDAPFKQEYIVPQMLYQLCNVNNSFNGIKYYSTKLDGRGDRHTLNNAMINYALPAQDVKISGYCPILASKLSLTEPITSEMCCDIPIEPMAGYFTSSGLPLLSVRNDELKNDETVLALDRMTMYFDKMLMGNDIDKIKPLYGWRKE